MVGCEPSMIRNAYRPRMAFDGPVSQFKAPGLLLMALDGLICPGSPIRPQWAFATRDGVTGVQGAPMLANPLPCPQTKLQSLIPQRRTW